MNKNTKIKIIVVLFIILMAVLIYIKIQNDKKEENSISIKMTEIFKSVKANTNVDVTKYFVYGTHFNIEGKVEIPKISGISITKANLIMKDIQDNEEEIETEYTYKNGILSFTTIKNINDGLYLENIHNSQYLFLRVLFSNNEGKIYSLKNATEYSNIEYYTITKNSKNNFINISFKKYEDIEYMELEIKKDVKLPENVYDIVIDPGHGGNDLGAKSNGKNESSIVLDCSNILKEKLTSLGYKVLVTRDENMPSTENTIYNMYDENGRVTVINKSHAKLLISLHMNNTSATLSKGGVEVFAPGKCKLTFAKKIADNIVNIANTTYSTLKLYRKEEGVYVHNYSQIDIESASKAAKKNGYEPYNITTDTSYLYILRETGGIATNAFVDGRNKTYSANKYVKSNIGVEGYSIDLGYMYIKKDLNNVIEKKELYMEAICKAILEY